MARICLVMIMVATAALSGCAVCDTCDDFPVPCVGPNCGGIQGQYTGGGPPVSMPFAGPVDPAADAAQMARNATGRGMPTPPPASPPQPMESSVR